MTQTAPYPAELADLVAKTTYRPGWKVSLGDILRDPPSTHAGEGRGLTLEIVTDTINSYPPHQRMQVHHFFIVPAATYTREAWQRWLFDQFVAVELHECMEFFTVDDEKPFAPVHAPGANPYTVTQLATDLDRRTSFRGQVNG